MIRLNLASEPEWLDLAAGVRIRLAPVTTAIIGAARLDPRVEAVPEGVEHDEMRAIAFAKAIAERAILEWDGVGGADDQPIAPSPKAVSALLDLYPLWQAFQLKVVAAALMLDAEKNASAPSPNGTTAAATPIARRARRGAATARRV